MFKSVRSSSLFAVSALLVASMSSAALAQAPTVTDVDGNEVVIEDSSRVATLGGVVTEIAYALGADDQIVAVDDSSYFPAEALTDKPTLGYYRALAAEPILASAPTLLIGNEESGPSEVLAQLREAGVNTLLLPDQNDVEGARELIRTMGRALGREDAAEETVALLDKEVAAAAELVSRATSSPRVLFVLRPPGAPTLVSGADTAAGEVIALAGGQNVYPNFDGYVPMTPEGIVEIAPDVILTTETTLAEFGGMDALLAAPGIAQTPAAENGRVVSMDDLYLLGFGPRTGQAIADLALLLHPELGS